MCASFAPPKIRITDANMSPDGIHSRGSRSRSPSSKARPKLVSPSSAGASSGSSTPNPKAFPPSTSSYAMMPSPASVADRPTPSSPAMPSFAEIARGVIKRDALSTHDPFARAARARAKEEMRDQRELMRRQRDLVRLERQLIWRKTAAAMIITLLISACGIFYVGMVVGGAYYSRPTLHTASQTTHPPPEHQQGRLFSFMRPPQMPPPPPRTTLLANLAANLPAIASSKDELASILKLAGVKAKPAQVDRAWSALTIGEMRNEVTNPKGKVRRQLTFTVEFLVASGLRNPWLVIVSSIFCAVAVVGMATCAAWVWRNAPEGNGVIGGLEITVGGEEGYDDCMLAQQQQHRRVGSGGNKASLYGGDRDNFEISEKNGRMAARTVSLSPRRTTATKS